MDAEQPPKRYLTWDEVDALCNEVVRQLQGKKFDLFLGITRGGLIPTGILSKRLDHANILTAAIMFYDGDDRRMPQPLVLQFPAEPLLHGKDVLIIDEVWHSGHTLALVKKMVLRAGGRPLVATLHYKPTENEVQGQPDFFAEKTSDWIVYPWESPAPTSAV